MPLTSSAEKPSIDVEISGCILISNDLDRIGKEVTFEWDEWNTTLERWTIDRIRQDAIDTKEAKVIEYEESDIECYICGSHLDLEFDSEETGFLCSNCHEMLEAARWERAQEGPRHDD